MTGLKTFADVLATKIAGSKNHDAFCPHPDSRPEMFVGGTMPVSVVCSAGVIADGSKSGVPIMAAGLVHSVTKKTMLLKTFGQN
jgi:hypothetical protein